MREIALLIYGMLHSMADISQSARDTILLRSNGDRDISGYFRKWARHNIANALFSCGIQGDFPLIRHCLTNTRPS